MESSSVKKINYGAFVKLCYTGRLDNGVVFNKTDKCKPLEIQVGDGSVVKGFEDGLIGMGVDERKSFIIGPDDAYGNRDEKLERRFDRAALQMQNEPFPGQVLLFMTRDGQERPAIVKFVNEEIIIADFNHPLAGRNLAFEVEVAEISEARDGPGTRCEAECCCA